MNNFLKDVLAVIVVYNKDLYDSQTLSSLGNDLAGKGLLLDLFVYDNSILKRKDSNIDGFSIVQHYHEGINKGVSAAYNTGAKFALELNKKWILLLDQDTFFDQDALCEYYTDVNEYPQINLFSPIIKIENGTFFSPFRKVFKRGAVLKDVKPIKYTLKNYSPVNSGMLISVASFFESGGYNEKVELDFSDLEFIKRFCVFNNEFKVVDTMCIQDFSNAETNVSTLNNRFVFFCKGVKNSQRKNILQDFQYFIIVMIRLAMLTVRTKKNIFFKTYYKYYFRGANRSGYSN